MEQQIAVSEKLNPNRIPCEPFGIKARSTLNRITLTPSEASPDETLYVDIPKLADNIVPGSVYLTFDLNVTGHANNALVNNVYSDTTKPPNYKITNLELEYRSISSEYLANQALEAYRLGHAFFY